MQAACSNVKDPFGHIYRLVEQVESHSSVLTANDKIGNIELSLALFKGSDNNFYRSTIIIIVLSLD
ncbi:hypothetical protein AFK20_06140 [Enhydrobacter aerosaccus]|uniref:Uncharacterized protein n=1 Tax=Enhydrobacter aerosaccus TaxID=225324 RepID=A0ABR5IMD4_9HYPH|nr:hypothetical protein AFK20_06140 [Enhydrobacter aerosaccus]